jgi:hypothetical protein
VPADLDMIRTKIETGPTYQVLNERVRERLAISCIKTALANVDRLINNETTADRVERWWMRMGFPDRGTYTALAAALPLGNENQITADEVTALFDRLEADGPDGVDKAESRLTEHDPTACPRPELFRAALTTCELLCWHHQFAEAVAVCDRVIDAFESRNGSLLLDSPGGKTLRSARRKMVKQAEDAKAGKTSAEVPTPFGSDVGMPTKGAKAGAAAKSGGKAADRTATKAAAGGKGGCGCTIA